MHILGEVQVPCPPQVGEQTGVLQVAPVQPVLHVQVFGAVQEPFTHDGLQIGVVQVAPVQPLLHVQVFGAVQEPFTHDGLQIGVVQVAPVQPVLHVQEPIEQLAFVPQLAVLLG